MSFTIVKKDKYGHSHHVPAESAKPAQPKRFDLFAPKTPAQQRKINAAPSWRSEEPTTQKVIRVTRKDGHFIAQV